MKKIIALLLLTIGIQGMLSAQGFSLHGKTTAIPDGEWIYLKVDNTLIDSALVSDRSFVFKTDLPYFPIQIFIHPKDLQKFVDYKMLWAENIRMDFDATNSGFKEAKISGSETQDESDRYYADLTLVGDDEPRFSFEKQYIRDNTNSFISVHSLSVYSSTWGKDTTQMLYDLLSNEIKATEYGKRIHHYLSLVKDPKIGDPYADFTMNDPDGNPVRFSDTFTRGHKYVLLEFWGSWCGPCRQENPNLVKTYEHFKEKGFEIFGVALESNYDNWVKAIKEDQLPWINVSDIKGDKNEAVVIYSVNAFPSNYLIDENGTIIARNLRGEQLNQKLNELLGNN